MNKLFHVGLQTWRAQTCDLLETLTKFLLYFLTTVTNETTRVWLFTFITRVFHDDKRHGDTPNLWKTHFLSTSSMRARTPRVWGWLWPRRLSTSCLRALSSRLRAATSFSSRQLSLSATLIVSGSPARADSFMESSTDSSQASRLPRAWSTFTTYTVEKQRG